MIPLCPILHPPPGTAIPHLPEGECSSWSPTFCRMPQALWGGWHPGYGDPKTLENDPTSGHQTPRNHPGGVELIVEVKIQSQTHPWRVHLQDEQLWCPSQALLGAFSRAAVGKSLPGPILAGPDGAGGMVEEQCWSSISACQRGRHLLPPARAWMVPGAAPGVTPGNFRALCCLCHPWVLWWPVGSWPGNDSRVFWVAPQHCGDLPHTPQQTPVPSSGWKKRVLPSAPF